WTAASLTNFLNRLIKCSLLIHDCSWSFQVASELEIQLSSRSLIKANVEWLAGRPGSFVECFIAFVACFEFHNI
ncbi:hypothetical protein H5410_023695, partial [Solanum commersonii]